MASAMVRACGSACAVVAAAVIVLADQPPLRSGLDLSAIDRSVRPQDDLFQFANGAWLARTEIPPDRVSYGTLAELTDQAETDLHAIIEGLPHRAKLTASQRQVIDLYASVMNEPRLEALGGAPMGAELSRIDAIDSARALAAEAGHLSSVGMGGPFGGVLAEDSGDRELPIVRLAQGGTVLPSRAYYLGNQPQYVNARREYSRYLERIFTLTDRAHAADDAAAVLALETALARVQGPPGGPRDGFMASNRYSLGRMKAEMPGFDWAAWAKPQGIDHIDYIIVTQPAFFRAFASLVPATPLETWKAWLASRYITAAAPYLSHAFADARFDFFGRTLTGQEEPRARWKAGVSLVSQYLGDSVGRLYVQERFPHAAKARAEQIVDRLIEAYQHALLDSPWLSGGVKSEGLRKLKVLKTDIGYPDSYREYGSLLIKPDDLVGNIARAKQFDGDYRLNRVMRSGDLNEWLMTPQTVNAFYTPELNSIIFPAAILQPPLFQPDADDAVNYGSIGAIIGHEIAHAFDARGRRYDADGEVRDWWPAADVRVYVARTRPLLAQLSAVQPLPGLRLNGAAAQNESLADLAGLEIALDAYHRSLKGHAAPLLDGFTGDQRVFIAWAQTWRTKMRDEYLRQLVATSAYPPPSFRANGSASNLGAFYDAFGVAPGDAMYRAPADRIKVW